MSDAGAAAIEAARAYVGLEPDARREAPYPVNEAMISHWVQAFGETNPIYTDAEVADGTRHGGVVAPPAMLGTWTLDVSAGQSGSARDRVLGALDDAGFRAVVATNYEQEYLRELRPGDHLVEEISIEEMSERKTTALGEGYFVTVRHDYRDTADDELVGVARMRLLKYQPPPPKPKAAASDDGPARSGPPRRPRPPVNRDNAFFWEGVEAGELRIQRCAECGVLRHPPRPMCASCQRTDWDTVTASGRGRIHSYAVHHHPPLPGVEPPHTVLLIELEEGVRIVSHLPPGFGPGDVAIGDAVELVFHDVDDELTLPLFRPAAAGQAASNAGDR